MDRRRPDGERRPGGSPRPRRLRGGGGRGAGGDALPRLLGPGDRRDRRHRPRQLRPVRGLAPAARAAAHLDRLRHLHGPAGPGARLACLRRRAAQRAPGELEVGRAGHRPSLPMPGRGSILACERRQAVAGGYGFLVLRRPIRRILRGSTVSGPLIESAGPVASAGVGESLYGLRRPGREARGRGGVRRCEPAGCLVCPCCSVWRPRSRWRVPGRAGRVGTCARSSRCRSAASS